ncbi:hypothetical protein COS91_03210 [Candidatus Desantisbacteria bacterium CG07_land_8_20_14_0_80_39_15]|uniref:HD-GYP domain-containing protein n=2 Tax=unclassified Candidatus Desantisiibacteriota TaxID=3106372 RepID=A0A2H9PAV1_9BACT|nr:MAG: hypothetical protein COS91_03210 [Candidatus Desantisbacteria bacterium CG07_land_8_20_14_0_80_39_15]PIZ15757.1 MAG: hypothetical protein COY51_04455 [Candidatus Desantisbacteria bacterium CG_4_10_14_0_8_um_filter_39_17]
MRISDILKVKVPTPSKKEPSPTSPIEPAKHSISEEKKTEEVSPAVSGERQDIYQELTIFMENFWLRLEKGKSLEKEALQNISRKFVNAFIGNSALIAELNKPTPPDDYLPYHSVNVCLLSVALGAKLGYSRERLFDLAQTSLLHDIGMIKIPKNVFLKSSPLSKEDMEKIEEHPLHGRSILENIKGITHDILHGVHQSHERENGQGYPDGYKNGDIHDFAKIIGLSDTYEALTHDRVYRKAMCPYKAIREIIRKDGQFFHLSFLKVLIETITFYPIGCYVQLNTGEIGIVKKIYSEFPMRPVVQIIWDNDKKKLEAGKEVDLSKQLLTSIKKIFKKETVDKFSESQNKGGKGAF